ncbi:bifunctional 4-hydroxy-3-methylbut-2-enyl diphosphate reductase/30S ribosomal protein S1 [Frisingicoccus sp.]|uniref:bifunctional 4-hydroxy-3-methylbut-2-enyl diphosphate reductase/30S ribosomal protein S1 n=1 Tax=Frisingicoccus sp. TaxID=1918627 RepID=UPI002A7F0B83|nr:bifunctional 4-hydroxy-3-methylbut-2-enyl diphosphate reductase/30S ribosomal protein S1 [Frisingicoccus sp.]MDY4833981.1 bifunctional 4-hydroxy-3-methylbut-2-enyl diphosphate reductase/30S ribosomal protein S1 [Frisingicoccus sp.]MDY4921887.1 bifunctional 4-hydroxy-3-methylbut-2-enyl diphosphate reductase/30S ribosomal protein S1 [Frisingicoccus sp.]MDY5957045.1 bifunctional 4-hydroxy-3-methylbut-2-enyl diphosphate reductase/30S ribosomal protein S1 [Frisingicoccus sp.]
MEIILAKSAGFCPGVRRAVDMVYEQTKEKEGIEPVYTYGPIIHNDEVVKDLEEKGVKVIHSLDELDHLVKGTVIIRSHGVSRHTCETIEAKGFHIVDATCPFVKRIHNIVEEQGKEGRDIIIIGNPEHPEVQGIQGWCLTPSTVIHTVDEAVSFSQQNDKKLCIISQTTFNYIKFKELVEILCKKGYDINCINSICNATAVRQEEARTIASKADAMIVIGDKNSSNTQKLYEISKKECENTYYIQTLVDLDLTAFESIRNVGITAGASTPNNIIEEVHTAMSEMSFEQLLEASLKTIRNGEVVEGTVIDVKEDEIILNIGYKADGIITRNEYSNTANLDLTTVVNVGDTMQAKVLKVNDGEGQVLLTYKRLLAEKGNKRLEDAYNNKEVLTAKVVNVLDGGLSVVVEEARVFIPASLVSDTYEKNLAKYEGQEISFVITEFNPRKRRIIGDRKQLLLAEKAQKQKELFERINVGDVVEGKVKNVTDFGAFIDLGGADGLLHISEMSWGRVENPKKLLKVGDDITVLIKDIQGEKIALSLKFADQNPWLTAAEKYAVGNVVEGKVARMTDFGAFVELEPGVDALLHVSQISREHVEKPADVLKVGETITAKVVDFNEEDRKISLSIKAMEMPVKEENTEE